MTKTKKITIHDVAKHAGVSATTVSRVLNNRGYLGEETKKKVQDSIETLGFVPNQIARSFYTHKTKFIGLIVPSVANPFFGELSFYLERELARKDYKVFLCNSINEIKNEKKYLTMLQENQVDGIIVATHNIDVKDYENLPLKVVSVDRYINNQIAIVHSDNYKGGEIATEHLIEQGCEKILCISGDPKLETPANLRLNAYRDTVKKHELPEFVEHIPFSLSFKEKKEALINIFEKKQYDGVFSGDDILALQILSIANEMNIQVPEEMKVVGFDGTSFVRNTSPQLTTIVQDTEKIAKATVEALLLKIEQDIHPGNLILPVHLSKGSST